MVKARRSLGRVGSEIFERLYSSEGREQLGELLQTKNGIFSIRKAMTGDNDCCPGKRKRVQTFLVLVAD
jgi:hypothetical protein